MNCINVRNEIGSEFWEEPALNGKNGIFPSNTVWFESGRSALEYIISDIKTKGNVKSVAIPTWCCESMIIPFYRAGWNIVFYSVYPDMNSGLVQEITEAASCDILLVMDYFGFSKEIDLSFFKGIIIRDITHSLFGEKQNDAHYFYGSLRKWCGVLTGGFAWKTDGKEQMKQVPCREEYIALRKRAMVMKKEYISGKRSDKDYLTVFRQAELLLDEETDGFWGANENDIELANSIDVNMLVEKRRENAEILLNELSDITLFSILKKTDCPLFVPILLPEKQRTIAQKAMIDNSIYCPMHWPISNYHILDDRSKLLYQQEISIVCDQRYDRDDMWRIVKVIRTVI